MNYPNKEKLDFIRSESNRIWSYLKECVNWLENKYYLFEELDERELIIYSRSCEESLKEIEKLTYELESEFLRLENE